MGTVTYGFNVSLDGYIEDSAGSFDWSMPDEGLHRHFNDLERETAVHLYGRGLYEVMRPWSTMDSDESLPEYIREYARLWQRVPNVVFSRTLTAAESNVRIVRDGIADEVARLKAGTDGYLALGGANIAAEFMRLGLIDEYRVYVAPVIVGSGKPMFQGVESASPLRLLDVERFAGGVVLLRYAPAQARA